MKIMLVLMAVCFIALSCAAPLNEKHERETRSSSHEAYGGRQFMPSYNPYNSYNPYMPYNPPYNPYNTNANNPLAGFLPALAGILPQTGK